MRWLLLLGVAGLMLIPVGTHALSLGSLELRSSLHQPLNARVPILSATADEIETLNVRVASPEQFARAGVKYAAVLTQLTFEIQQTRKGPDYILITSRDPIQEPFLNFLIEVNWAKGRLIREFTALLDPPLYDPNRRISWSPAQVKGAVPAAPGAVAAPPATIAREFVPSPAKSATAESWRRTEHEVQAARGGAAASTAPGRATATQEGAYPTLWSAAAAMRPDSSVSMQQMMIALLRTNPDAFIRSNINLLKKGYVLKMPDQSALASISRSEALVQVKQHHALWQEYRQRGAANARKQPEGAAVAATAPASSPDEGESGTSTAMTEESAADDKLKLLAAKDAGAGAAGGASNNAEELALTKETLESKARENEELRAQLVESEEIIEKLKSRIALQDNELAALQRKLAEATGAATGTTTPAVPTPLPQVSAPESWRSLENEVYVYSGAPGAATVSEAAEPAPVEIPTEEATPSEETPAEPEVAATTPPEQTAEETLPSEETTEEAMPEEVAPAEPTRTETTAEEVRPAETPAEVTTQAAKTTGEGPAEVSEPVPEGKGLVARLSDIAGGFLPSSLLDAIPGGVLTLLGLIGAVLAGLVALVARRRAAPAPASIPAVAYTHETIEEDTGSNLTAMSAEAEAAVSAAAEEDLFRQGTVQMSATAPRVETAPGEVTQEDPLAEVNVYLAYERFDEAERLIKEAIVSHPNEHKYKLRLLEVYYSSNNKAAYEAAARTLRDAVGGSGPLWDSAVAMWREMSPNRALFAAGVGPEAASASPARQFVDITTDMDEHISRTVTSTTATRGAGVATADLAATDARAGSASGGLDFDLGAGEKDVFEMLDITAPSEEEKAASEVLDISAGNEPEMDSILDLSVPSAIEGASSAVQELLTLTKTGAVSTVDSGMATLAEPEIMDAEFDITGGESGEAADLAGLSPADTAVEFDLGGADLLAGGPAGPSNVVDFPGRAEATADTPPSLDTLTTMVDIAPVTPQQAQPFDFDIGSLDLSLEDNQPKPPRGPEVDDIDSLSLDVDTVRLFENDLASSEQETVPMFQSDAGAAATANDVDIAGELRSVGGAAESRREASTLDELPLEGDDLTLDDITKSLEETVGVRDQADVDTVDLTLDAGTMSEIEETAELFRDDLKPTSAAETAGLPESPFAEGQGTVGEVDTKLNLAKAYIELGDAAGARSILDEVVNEGTAGQREEAQRLLRELTT